MSQVTIGEAMLKRVRDYAVTEPSFTVPFMVWELGIGRGAADAATRELLRLRIVKQIEPAAGIYAAVYAYTPPPRDTVSRHFPELDAHRMERELIGTDAPKRGVEVPHTGGAVGASGRPGRDRKKQEAGFKVKRKRQGT